MARTNLREARHISWIIHGPLRQHGKVIFQTAGLGYHQHAGSFIRGVLQDVWFLARRMDEIVQRRGSSASGGRGPVTSAFTRWNAVSSDFHQLTFVVKSEVMPCTECYMLTLIGCSGTSSQTTLMNACRYFPAASGVSQMVK
jgi:hypothetical protein